MVTVVVLFTHTRARTHAPGDRRTPLHTATATRETRKKTAPTADLIDTQTRAASCRVQKGFNQVVGITGR